MIRTVARRAFFNIITSGEPSLAEWASGFGGWLYFFNSDGSYVFSDAAATVPITDTEDVRAIKDVTDTYIYTQSGASGLLPNYYDSDVLFNNKSVIIAESGNYLTFNNAVVANLTNYVLYHVFLAQPPDTNAMQFWGERPATNLSRNVGWNYRTSDNRIRFEHRDDANAVAVLQSTLFDLTDGIHLLTFVRSAANAFAMRLDGTQIATSTTNIGTTTLSHTRLFSGVSGSPYVANTFWSGMTGVIAARADSSANTDIENQLMNYYGIG